MTSEDFAFEMLFDERQILTTIFHFISTDASLNAAADRVGLPPYATLDEAQRAAVSMGVPFDRRENVHLPELGLSVSWCKLTLEGHSRHYRFSEKALKLKDPLAWSDHEKYGRIKRADASDLSGEKRNFIDQSPL